jgi:hypothetical protein
LGDLVHIIPVLNVSGDEKLFHFTGLSGNVRLVISKPDRIGFWIYELCGRFANGWPFLLDVFMHNSLEGIQGWIHAMKESKVGYLASVLMILN